MNRFQSAVVGFVTVIACGCGNSGPYDLAIGTGDLPSHVQLHISLKQADGLEVLNEAVPTNPDTEGPVYGHLLASGTSYVIDVFIDQDSNGRCDPSPVDKMWHQEIPAVSNDVTLNLSALKLDVAACDAFAGKPGSGAPVAFTAVYEAVFHNRQNALQCTGCHDFLGRELSKQQLYARLVNEPAQREPCKGEVRVVPGDLQASLLWKKLAPDLSVCGSKMPRSLPLFGPAPNAAQLDLLRAWIEGGALP